MTWSVLLFSWMEHRYSTELPSRYFSIFSHGKKICTFVKTSWPCGSARTNTQTSADLEPVPLDPEFNLTETGITVSTKSTHLVLLTTARKIRCRSSHATACLSTASLVTSNTPEESWFRRRSPVTKCSFVKIAVCYSRRTKVHSERLEQQQELIFQWNIMNIWEFHKRGR